MKGKQHKGRLNKGKQNKGVTPSSDFPSSAVPSSGVPAVQCWNCNGVMRRFAQDTFYWYYKCPKCGKERLELKTDIGPMSPIGPIGVEEVT
jgi:ssDNA-binding Zn-finger/Zn-ribbon topoisomerase 1